MKVLNKSVSKYFESFYQEIVARIGVPKFSPSPTPGQGDSRLEGGTPVLRLRTDLSRPNFEHHAAHELLHALQLVEGWPRPISRLPDKSATVQLGIMLGSIVLDLNVEDRLKQLSFDSKYILDNQYGNLKKAVLDENIPSSQSFRWRKATLMYAYASLSQPRTKWVKLKQIFSRRAPHIAEKGEELASILKICGWNSPDQALASMTAIRKGIGLASEKLGILDGRTGQRF